MKIFFAPGPTKVARFSVIGNVCLIIALLSAGQLIAALASGWMILALALFAIGTYLLIAWHWSTNSAWTASAARSNVSRAAILAFASSRRVVC